MSGRDKRALVVHAHPDPESYSHALFDRAVAGLTSGGWTVDAIDLYADRFEPAMSLDERIAYHGEEPVVAPEVERSVDLVLGARALVFVYPTWWWGMPAVMKGWIERVMVPGVGFVFDEKGRVKPGLRHVRRLVGVTTYGSRRGEMAAFNDAGRRVVNRALWLSTARLRTRRLWLGLYGMDRIGDDERNAFAARVEERLTRL